MEHIWARFSDETMPQLDVVTRLKVYCSLMNISRLRKRRLWASAFGQKETFDRPAYWLYFPQPNLINIGLWETQSARYLQ